MNNHTVSLPQAQETPKDIILRLAHYLLQQDRARASAQARTNELEHSLDRERAAHEATKRERDKLMAELKWAAGIVRDLENKMQPVNEYVASLERQLGETQLELGAARDILQDILQSEAVCNCGPYFSQGEALERRIHALLLPQTARGVGDYE